MLRWSFISSLLLFFVSPEILLQGYLQLSQIDLFQHYSFTILTSHPTSIYPPLTLSLSLSLSFCSFQGKPGEDDLLPAAGQERALPQL